MVRLCRMDNYCQSPGPKVLTRMLNAHQRIDRFRKRRSKNCTLESTHHPPDLIITDYQMPIMSGLELVRTLRAQGATMPILVLSSDTSMAEAILAVGATAFLPKPSPIRALRGLLR